jgi:putative transcriptional regulator
LLYWENIRRMRQYRNLTQRELADRIGVHRTTINRIEKRVLKPSLDLLESIANALNVSLAELLKEETE